MRERVYEIGDSKSETCTNTISLQRDVQLLLGKKKKSDRVTQSFNMSVIFWLLNSVDLFLCVFWLDFIIFLHHFSQ